jgi:hypothetical protein
MPPARSRASRRVALIACCVAAVLALVASARVRADDAGDAGPAWTPVITPFGQLFPSLVLATATMPPRDDIDERVFGDSNGVVGIALTATRDKQRVRVRIKMPQFARDTSYEATLPRKGRRYEIYPTVLWDFAALRANRQSRPESIEFAVSVDGRRAGNKVERVRVRSINEAPYFVKDGAHGADLNWMFAAYVNEDHPLVQEILRDALASGIVDRFDGYQSRDPEQVYRQVFAIWHVLKQRGIRYSSIARTSAGGDAVLSQYVRFLDESWRNSQANCVDGSVLLASILRRIDLNPSLVLVPGHMFLAFDVDARGRERAYLETTLLGRDGDVVKRRARVDDSAMSEAERLSLASFESAVARGLAAYRRAGDNFQREDEPEFHIIAIEAARKMGVAPIAPLSSR